MSELLRLRIAVGDTPGALAAVAGLIAKHEGNIVSVDVHEMGVVNAVDDIVVRFRNRKTLAELRNELTTTGAGSLIHDRAADWRDPVLGVLDSVMQVLKAPRDALGAELVRTIGRMCLSPAVWISSHAGASTFEAGALAQKQNRPIALRTDTLPPERSAGIEETSWLLAVPYPEDQRHARMLFVARPLEDEFTSTEIARIQALLRLHMQLEQGSGHMPL